MRPVRAWTFYLLAVFAGGALLAPWVHAIAQALAQAIPTLESIAGAPFHRYVTRCVMALALGGLWPLFRASGLLSWPATGLVPVAPRRLLHGFAWGFVSLAVVLAVALAGQGRMWNTERSGAEVARHLANAGLAAVVVSPLEELLFRGGVFGVARRAYGGRMAIVASSLVYAAVHFLDRARWEGQVTWWSGFSVLARMWSGSGDMAALAPKFITLALAGIVLALAYHRTGNLWFSMGLHAGWIFWLKSYAFLTAGSAGAAAWFWGSARLVDGWLAAAAMACVLAGVWKWEPPAHNKLSDHVRASDEPGPGCA